MKKIININLSGRVIPIEDAAYESLQRYIESLRRYFAAEEGRDEIINDIESRIAELMNDKVRKGAAAVTEADMDEIIASMGRVEDFEATVSSTTGQTAGAAYEPNFTYSESTGKQRFKGRLYRDRTDKMLGGVCAGIANYINVDPAVVRLLFAIITFGGFGFGFFLYILAWAILPASDLDGYSGKRLFRNPDDRIIGGVAGGLAAYFNKSASTIRLIFAAPLLLNIVISVLNGVFDPFDGPNFPNVFAGSLTGTFFLAYIVLWIVLPEARSAFEKMEMRGEKVDVNSIKQNVQDRAQAFGQEVRDSAQRFSAQATQFANTRGRSFAAEVAETARPVASGIGHAIGVLFKAFFIFIAGSIAFGLFVALIVLVFGGGPAVWPMKESIMDFVLDGFWQKTFFWGTIILFLAVPLIAFITWLVRRLMKVRSQRHYLGWTFAGLWTLGWISASLLAASLGKDFRFKKEVAQDVAVAQPLNNRMLVSVAEPAIEYSGDWWWVDDNEHRGWDLTEDSMKLANVDIRVVKSEDSNYSVTVYKYSRGNSRRAAETRATNIKYAVGYADSVLNLGSGFAIGRNNKFRAQEVVVEIRVPVGKKLRFDPSVTDKLEPMNVRIGEPGRRNRDWDGDWDYDRSFDWQTGVDYVMTDNGDLVSTDVQTSSTSTEQREGVYEYKSGGNSDSLRRSIEEKERQLQEERRRLEELERTSTSAPSRVKPETTAFVMQPLFPFII
jgi:phage shock protein PspC (stress-responsive transcriptional regulator)